MPRDAVGDYLGRESVAVVQALSAAKYNGERDGVSKIAGIGGRQLIVGVGHPSMIAETWERSKNEGTARLLSFGLRRASPSCSKRKRRAQGTDAGSTSAWIRIRVSGRHSAATASVPSRSLSLGALQNANPSVSTNSLPTACLKRAIFGLDLAPGLRDVI